MDLRRAIGLDRLHSDSGSDCSMDSIRIKPVCESPREDSVEQITLIAVPHWELNPLPGRFGIEVVLVVCIAGAMLFQLPMIESVMVAATAWCAYLVFTFLLSRTAAKKYCAKPGSPNLVCQGTPRDLDTLEVTHCDLLAPYVTWATAPPSGARGGLLLLGLPCAIMTSTLALGYGLALAVAIMCLMIIVVRLSFSWLFPVYYRISPGLVEILRYRLFNSKQPVGILKITLDNAQIVTCFRQGLMTICNDTEVNRIPLGSIPAVHQFVKAVFHAAVCKKRAPSLPTDTLLG